jgi:hypothetical protein
LKWEYKVLLSKTNVCVDPCALERKPLLEGFQNELNSLGDYGWELVTVQNICLEDGGLFSVAYLKQQKK